MKPSLHVTTKSSPHAALVKAKTISNARPDITKLGSGDIKPSTPGAALVKAKTISNARPDVTKLGSGDIKPSTPGASLKGSISSTPRKSATLAPDPAKQSHCAIKKSSTLLSALSKHAIPVNSTPQSASSVPLRVSHKKKIVDHDCPSKHRKLSQFNGATRPGSLQSSSPSSRSCVTASVQRPSPKILVGAKVNVSTAHAGGGGGNSHAAQRAPAGQECSVKPSIQSGPKAAPPPAASKTEVEAETEAGFWVKVRLDSLRRVCEDMGAPVSGNRETLISRIIGRLGAWNDDKAAERWLDELTGVRMSTLRRVCGDLSMPMSGNKTALIRRLIPSLASSNGGPREPADSKAHTCVKGAVRPGASDFSSVWQEWPCDGCGRADREDEMVLCDMCDAGWHLDCLSPALSAVPDGDWLCPECAVARRVSVSSAPSPAQHATSPEASRKRVRYPMLHSSSERNLDHRDRPLARGCRSLSPGKRQRIAVARFRFSSIEAQAAQQQQ
jgi:hypothetical protein